MTLLDLLLVWRGELSRPAAQQSEPHLDAYANKVGASLDRLERDIELLTSRSFGIGHIATGCTLSYLDFRFPTLDWRRGHSRLQQWHTEFEQRPSVCATAVVDDS
jgi:glutathione S-transferase